MSLRTVAALLPHVWPPEAGAVASSAASYLKQKPCHARAVAVRRAG